MNTKNVNVTPDNPVSNHAPGRPAGRINLDDQQSVNVWCEYFGITSPQLEEAVAAAGVDGDAVREHLLNQGASSGPG